MLYCNIYFYHCSNEAGVSEAPGQCCSGAFLNKSHAVYDLLRKGMMKRGLNQ